MLFFTRLVTPQPHCRLILLLLSYLAPVTIWACSHNHYRNICLGFSLDHLSKNCPQFPAGSYPTCQHQFLWILAQITLLPWELKPICSMADFSMLEKEECLSHELLQVTHWHSNWQLRDSDKAHCKVALSDCHSSLHPHMIPLLVTG